MNKRSFGAKNVQTMKKDNLDELQTKLKALDPLSPLERLKQALLLTAGAIDKLKADILENGFTSIENEISFFKATKPNFYALQIYEVDLYNITVNEPLGTAEMKKTYYEQELLYIIRFFRTHAFHYQYYRTGARDLDQQYFTRDGRPGDVPVLDLAEPFPGFSTPLDYLFAKFIAYERMQLELIDKLTGLYSAATPKAAPKLKWTGETINLVEIAYGIWLTSQINEGQASMAEICRFLEEIFDVHIGDPNRRWQDITRRKTISPTRYLDLTISEINKRIDNERSLNRQKRRSPKS